MCVQYANLCVNKSVCMCVFIHLSACVYPSVCIHGRLMQRAFVMGDNVAKGSRFKTARHPIGGRCVCACRCEYVCMCLCVCVCQDECVHICACVHTCRRVCVCVGEGGHFSHP